MKKLERKGYHVNSYFWMRKSTLTQDQSRMIIEAVKSIKRHRVVINYKTFLQTGYFELTCEGAEDLVFWAGVAKMMEWLHRYEQGVVCRQEACRESS